MKKQIAILTMVMFIMGSQASFAGIINPANADGERLSVATDILDILLRPGTPPPQHDRHEPPPRKEKHRKPAPAPAPAPRPQPKPEPRPAPKPVPKQDQKSPQKSQHRQGAKPAPQQQPGTHQPQR